jgi:hypothetical protein
MSIITPPITVGSTKSITKSLSSRRIYSSPPSSLA